MINKVILVGYLGRDPEVRYTSTGTPVANFSVATSEKWNDRQSGEKREHTEWHRISAWGSLGEICGKYLAKGRLVYIEGKLNTKQWEKDGITHYTTEIIATNIKFLGGDGGGQRRGGDRGDSYNPYSDSDHGKYGGAQEDDYIPF